MTFWLNSIESGQFIKVFFENINRIFSSFLPFMEFCFYIFSKESILLFVFPLLKKIKNINFKLSIIKTLFTKFIKNQPLSFLMFWLKMLLSYNQRFNTLFKCRNNFFLFKRTNFLPYFSENSGLDFLGHTFTISYPNLN